MRGKLYSVGIGPGDQELMTLKAVRLLKECDVVALPKGDTDVMTAKEIVNHVVDLDAKPQLIIYMPMTADAIPEVRYEKKHVSVKVLLWICIGCPVLITLITIAYTLYYLNV